MSKPQATLSSSHTQITCPAFRPRFLVEANVTMADGPSELAVEVSAAVLNLPALVSEILVGPV